MEETHDSDGPCLYRGHKDIWWYRDLKGIWWYESPERLWWYRIRKGHWKYQGSRRPWWHPFNKDSRFRHRPWKFWRRCRRKTTSTMRTTTRPVIETTGDSSEQTDNNMTNEPMEQTTMELGTIVVSGSGDEPNTTNAPNVT